MAREQPIRRVLNQITEAKGLPQYHPHLLHHACGTHMHDHGAPLQAVATFLGPCQALNRSNLHAGVGGRMMETYKKAHPHAGYGR